MTAEHVFHRSTSARPPVAVRGEGIFLIDDGGHRYIDACGGAAVSCLGHGDRRVISAMADQAARLEYVHTGFFTTDAAEELATVVADLSPGALDRVWFTSSGSEAIEAARQMLISFGTIKQAERDGMFHSLPRQELALLLLASGAVQISVHSAFDDQAYLAVAEKPPRS